MARGNPLAVTLVMVGAVVMVVANFLPLYEATGFFLRIQENTLIQHGGWLLIAAAVGIAATGFAARNGKGWGAPFGLAVISGVILVFWVLDKQNRTLYPIAPSGTMDTSSSGMVAAVGIALYVAGLGIGLVCIGSLLLWQAEKNYVPAKKCPDCAETVLGDAQVCKHCGYRFSPPTMMLGRARTVRCQACGTGQTVSPNGDSHPCQSCGAMMDLTSL